MCAVRVSIGLEASPLLDGGEGTVALTTSTVSLDVIGNSSNAQVPTAIDVPFPTVLGT